eukprot:2213607-Alexandrium_andersonii.AAC.1
MDAQPTKAKPLGAGPPNSEGRGKGAPCLVALRLWTRLGPNNNSNSNNKAAHEHMVSKQW